MPNALFLERAKTVDPTMLHFDLTTWKLRWTAIEDPQTRIYKSAVLDRTKEPRWKSWYRILITSARLALVKFCGKIFKIIQIDLRFGFLTYDNPLVNVYYQQTWTFETELLPDGSDTPTLLCWKPFLSKKRKNGSIFRFSYHQLKWRRVTRSALTLKGQNTWKDWNFSLNNKKSDSDSTMLEKLSLIFHSFTSF